MLPNLMQLYTQNTAWLNVGLEGVGGRGLCMIIGGRGGEREVEVRSGT